MTALDHVILKVNDIDESVAFYTEIMGFENAGVDGPFTVIRVSETFQIQLAQSGAPGSEHYAFAVSGSDFDKIFERIKTAGLDYGPSFDSVGSNAGPGVESGARGEAPTLYFFDPNEHLLEIRTYAEPESA